MASRRAPKDASARRRPTSRSRIPEPGATERSLLRLARELAALGRRESSPVAALERALTSLAGASGGPPPRGSEKVRRLALGWAREQVRLALEELLEAGAKAGALRNDIAPGFLAWLLLAATEALAREVPDAVADRLQALHELVRPGAGPA